MNKFHQLTILFAFMWMLSAQAQTVSPQLLPVPKDWKFERMDFPLDFAPDLKLEGYEELRFSPGMFDTQSAYYFTYLFALQITNRSQLSKEELHTFLLDYYRGLSEAVAVSKKIKIDISDTQVELNKSKESDKSFFTAQINFFDTFTNSQKIVLNMELEVFANAANEEVYLLALVSPQQKNSDIWKHLYEIRKQIMKENIFE